MSLLRQFPEVDRFFKRDQFSKDELGALILKIEKKYTDLSVLNSAKTLIKLELLKYDLQRISREENPKVVNHRNPSKREVPPMPLQIDLLAQKLEWAPKHLLMLLKQRNINKSENDILTPEESLTIRDLVNARYLGVMRNHEEENKLKSSGRVMKSKEASTYDDNVYERVSLYGPGKLIYIRSR